MAKGSGAESRERQAERKAIEEANKRRETIAADIGPGGQGTYQYQLDSYLEGAGVFGGLNAMIGNKSYLAGQAEAEGKFWDTTEKAALFELYPDAFRTGTFVEPEGYDAEAVQDRTMELRAQYEQWRGSIAYADDMALSIDNQITSYNETAIAAEAQLAELETARLELEASTQAAEEQRLADEAQRNLEIAEANEANRVAQALNDRDTLFMSRQEALDMATADISQYYNEQRSYAGVNSLDFQINAEERTGLIENRFADIWSAENETNYQALAEEFGQAGDPLVDRGTEGQFENFTGINAPNIALDTPIQEPAIQGALLPGLEPLNEEEILGG